MQGPGPNAGIRRATTGLLKAGAVFAIIALGLYALFGGGPHIERRAVKALEHDDVLIGASLDEWPSDGNNVIRDFERQTDVRLDIVDVFLDWFTPWHNVSHTVDHIARHGSIPQLSWESHAFTTRDILDGTEKTPLRDGRRISLDAYLDEFANGLCDSARISGTPILLRTMHEFNGNWFSWGIAYQDSNGNHPNTDQSYREAWIKIHGIVRQHCGAEQVKFVWAVNHFSVGTGASFAGPYPGDDYVDFVGLDGYNWGTNAKWGWQSFDTIFSAVYCDVSRVTSKPILLAEIASTEKGGSKPQWITDMIQRLEYKAYPGIVGFVWFNNAKYEVEIRGNMDWPITSSPDSVAAFKQAAQQLVETRDGSTPPPAPPTVKGPSC